MTDSIPTNDPYVPPSETPTTAGSGWKKGGVLLGFVATAATVFYFFGDQLTFASLAAKEEWLRSSADANLVLAIGAAFLLYVAVTGLSLPGAAVMTLLCGWLFGFVTGTLIVSFASTLGATLAFLFARYLLRDSIRAKFGDKLQTFEQNLEQDGPYYLFTLRLIPAVPFFVINLVMGLTPIRTWTYWWVSQLGMLAGTMAYVWAGSTVDLQRLADQGVTGLVSPQLIAAFAVLGVLPIAIKKILERFGPKSSTTPAEAA